MDRTSKLRLSAYVRFGCHKLGNKKGWLNGTNKQNFDDILKKVC